METMKPLLLAVLLLTVIGFTACNEEAADVSVAGDAYIITKKIGQDTLNGLALHAYSFSGFTNVSVTSGTDATKSYTLGKYFGQSNSYYYETPTNQYAASLPVAGAYNFTATFENGEVKTDQDILTTDVLKLPTLTKCEYNSTDHKAELNWTVLPNANIYVVKIYDGNNWVFVSQALPGAQTTYSISYPGNGWDSSFSPVAGKAYTVVFCAFRYETNGSDYDIQATSEIEHSLTWGS